MNNDPTFFKSFAFLILRNEFELFFNQQDKVSGIRDQEFWHLNVWRSCASIQQKARLFVCIVYFG